MSRCGGRGRAAWRGPTGLVLSVMLAGACAPAGPAIRIERPVLVRPVGGAPAAVYFTVVNRGTTSDTIVGVDVDVADRTSMHTQQQHRMGPGGAGSMALMTRVESVPVAGGEELRFAPGGFHGMADGIRRPLRRGDSVRVTIRLARASAASAAARVVDYEDLDTVLVPASRPERIRSLLTRLAASAGWAAPGPTAVPSATEGRALYLSNGCATCHGPNGQGDGPIARTLDPRPRDFRDAAAFKNGTTIASIAQTIATGVAAGGAMPLFAHLTNGERQSLAVYVISLRNQPAARTLQP